LLLDGLVIKGSMVKQGAMEGFSVTGVLLKKHSLVIFLSLLMHIVLLLLLLFITEPKQAKQVNITHKAIKSYLYKMPAKVAINKPTLVKEIPDDIKTVDSDKLAKTEKKQNQQQSPITETTTDKPITQKVNPATNMSLINDSSKIEPLVKPPISSKLTPKKKASAQSSFSSYQQLKDLRMSLNNKILQQSFSDLQQFRSPSIMHGEQIPVPHSDKQLSEEEIRQKSTARMSNDISITKNANGTCTITREQFLGSPVEESTSGFFCGESKFDKSFREHMKKVQDKIMPSR
jgi:hypothetical protein